MIHRVTHQTVQRSTLANLQLNLGAISDLQGKLSSGKNVAKPSDDPGGVARSLQLRSDRRAAEQHGRNADDGNAWLTTVDGALQTSVSVLRRARDLTVQGAGSGAQSPAAREALAVEVEGLRDALLAQSDASYLGRTVFAGTSDAGHAFTDASGTPPWSWTGAPAAPVERRVGPQTTVRVDADGAAAFGQGPYDPTDPTGGSVFALLDQVAADLRSGADVQGHLNRIDGRMSAMLAELADVGARQNQVETARAAVEKTVMDVNGQITAIEDIDLAEVLVQIQSQEVAYQAALGATARVLQPSLMEFLR